MQFIVNVEYNLESSETGDIALIIQGASNESLANEFYVAEKGKHVETLQATITIPETRLIRVFTPLTLQNDSSSTIVETFMYKVSE